MRPVRIRFGRGCAWPVRIALATAAALAGAAAIPAGIAIAQPSASGTVTETITTGILSVTLCTSSVKLCSTTDPLTFPNGDCRSSDITITNGTAPSEIDVNGQGAVPADAGTPGAGPDWTLCSPNNGTAPTYNGPACTPAKPGQDQYNETTVSSSGTTAGAQVLSDLPQCDAAFDLTLASNPNCAATSNQSQAEGLALIGPSSSTDPSQTWTSEVTWTAVAQ